MGVDQAPNSSSLAQGQNVRVSPEAVPELLAQLIQKLDSTPPEVSRSRLFVKDYLPVVTPIAAVLVTAIVAYGTYKINQAAYEINRAASEAASTERLGKIIDDFGQTADSRKRTIAAMKLAAYGNLALPAIKLAFGAQDPQLRADGVLIAEEMYRSETIGRGQLTAQILSYYADPVFRPSVLRWLVEMGRDLSPDHGRLAFEKLRQALGPFGEGCKGEESEQQLDATRFLTLWADKDSKQFIIGLAKNCTAEGARNQAIGALPALAKALPDSESQALVVDLRAMENPKLPNLQALIEQCIREIESKK